MDTRPAQGEFGGQYGVSTFDSGGSLGKYRYFLFDVARTENEDPFGNTFYSEIDVVTTNAPLEEAAPFPKPGRKTFEADGGKYQFSVDTSETPELTRWAHDELAPVVQVW